MIFISFIVLIDQYLFALIIIGNLLLYSVLKLFTGFAIAALIAWKLTVTMQLLLIMIAVRQKPTIQYLSGNYNPAAIYSLHTMQQERQL